MNIHAPAFLLVLVAGSLGVAVANKAVAGVDAPSNWGEPAALALPSEHGPIEAVVRHRHFTWTSSKDQHVESHDIVAIVVPSINTYWLGFSCDQQTDQDKTQDLKFFVFGNSIIGVSADRGELLNFYVSSSRLTTTDTAQELDTILHQKLDRYESQPFDPKLIQLQMGSFIGYLSGHEDIRNDPAPIITRIEVKEGAFTLEMTGGKDNTVPATITFDNSFVPQKATRNGLPCFPRGWGFLTQPQAHLRSGPA